MFLVIYLPVLFTLYLLPGTYLNQFCETVFEGCSETFSLGFGPFACVIIHIPRLIFLLYLIYKGIGNYIKINIHCIFMFFYQIPSIFYPLAVKKVPLPSTKSFLNWP